MRFWHQTDWHHRVALGGLLVRWDQGFNCSYYLVLGLVRLHINWPQRREQAGYCLDPWIQIPGIGRRRLLLRAHVHCGGALRPWFRPRVVHAEWMVCGEQAPASGDHRHWAWYLPSRWSYDL